MYFKTLYLRIMFRVSKSVKTQFLLTILVYVNFFIHLLIIGHCGNGKSLSLLNLIKDIVYIFPLENVES